ncbi:SixA phosphatase family protein [Boseongicola aestuarii]|uniref:2,3-bisphosphoglycerate-dependent phosphoglycerate mutase n=1 Tax=Boseongicola aestuarii TaxID=1470561 RepID=A0A238J5W5_9RHOB|nr:phosphoglycerate mutase family protein [Boseongicola aestuarii]SMX25622.1 2,3-bisphosphoglycerate-dependent phosphoglycerate mutase [Boseongicola aestuarii]
MRKLWFALTVLPAMICAGMTEAQEKVFLIRHAEEELLSGANPKLSSEGRERAARYASMLRDAEIDVLFSSSTVRTQETGDIIAESLGVPSHSFNKYGYGEMLAQVEAQNVDDTILIVGNSGTIPTMLRLLGVVEEVKVSKSDYDNLFLVVPNDNGPSQFVRLRMP